MMNPRKASPFLSSVSASSVVSLLPILPADILMEQINDCFRAMTDESRFLGHLPTTSIAASRKKTLIFLRERIGGKRRELSYSSFAKFITVGGMFLAWRKP